MRRPGRDRRERPRLLDAVAISEEIGASKPDERAYRRAAEFLGCEPGTAARPWSATGGMDITGAIHAGCCLATLVSDRPVELPSGADQVQMLDEVTGCLRKALLT